jgi:type II secretory pathway component PulK
MKLRSRNSGRRGSALIAVIWLIMLLSFITVATIRVVGFDLDVATADIHGFRAKQLAEMGISIGANPAVDRIDPLLSQWSGDEGFEVTLSSEGSKFNINAILQRDDRALLKAMFANWGMDIEEADLVIDALVDWIDPDDQESLNGAEIAYYEELGRINQPFNRPFFHIEEMRLVRGMDLVEALRPDWREWFTIWSSGGLDINEADPEMIAVAAEVTVEDAMIIAQMVRGPDGQLDTEDDVRFESPQEALALIGVDGSLRPDILARFSANETTTRIESVGITPGAKRRISIVVRNRTGRPSILERTEEVIP